MLYPIELRARSAHFWSRPIKLGEFGWEVNPFCRARFRPGVVGPPSGEGDRRRTGQHHRRTAGRQELLDLLELLELRGRRGPARRARTAFWKKRFLPFPSGSNPFQSFPALPNYSRSFPAVLAVLAVPRCPLLFNSSAVALFSCSAVPTVVETLAAPAAAFGFLPRRPRRAQQKIGPRFPGAR
jgi:hypothetical protein